MSKLFNQSILLILALTLFSCTKSEEAVKPGLELNNLDELKDSPVVSFLGGTFHLKFTSSADWTAGVSYIDGENWLSIDKNQGTSGENTLVITSLPNDQQEVRTATVTLKSGNGMRAVQVKQEAYQLKVNYPQNFISPLGRDLSISISSAYEYVFSKPDCDWLKFKGESKIKNSTVFTYTVAPNLTGSVRETKLTLRLKGYDRTDDIVLKQEGITSATSAWMDKDFYKHGILFKFTSSTCSNCPGYSTMIAQAQSIVKDRMLTYSINTFDPVKPISYENVDMSKYYPVSGVPVGIFDGRAMAENRPGVLVDMLTGLAKEGIHYAEHVYYNAELKTTVSGSRVKVDANVYAKEAGPVRMVVALIEDGIVGKQTNPDHSSNEKYVHNHILRKFFTESQGNTLLFENAGTQSVSYEMETAGLVTDIRNCKVIVYFFRDILSNETTVPYVSSLNYPEYIDNAIEVKVGESCELRFE